MVDLRLRWNGVIWSHTASYQQKTTSSCRASSGISNQSKFILLCLGKNQDGGFHSFPLVPRWGYELACKCDGLIYFLFFLQVTMYMEKGWNLWNECSLRVEAKCSTSESKCSSSSILILNDICCLNYLWKTLTLLRLPFHWPRSLWTLLWRLSSRQRPFLH